MVIGNASYPKSPLSNTINDARDIAGKLRSLGFSVKEHVDLSRKDLARAINEFLREIKSSDSIALFYYSGHGLQIDGVNYLIPIDSEIEDALDVPNEAVPVDQLLVGMNGRNDNAMNLIILDACRDNPFRESDQKSLGQKGLARVNIASKGTLILYATKPGDTASDNPRGRNGLFTQQLLKAMDMSNIQIEDVFKQTANDVFLASNKKQMPWMEGVIFGKFYLKPPREQNQTGDPLAHGSGTIPLPPPPPQSPVGYLQIRANVNNAEVKLNGKIIGHVNSDQPLNYNEGLPAGPAEVEISAPGYLAIHKSIEIIPDQWNSLQVALAKSIAIDKLENPGESEFSYTDPRFDKTNKQNGNLYALIIGVADFDDNNLDLDSASDNATEFSQAIGNQSKGLYKSIHIKTLNNPNNEAFLDGLDWLSSKLTTNVNDTLLFYFSGRYAQDPDGEIYFLAKDTNPERMRRTAMPSFEIYNTIIPFSGKKLVFFDFPKQAPARNPASTTGMMNVFNEFVTSGGEIVVFQNVAVNQGAIGSSQLMSRNFTKALIDGLTGRADYTKSGEISINKLDLYLSDRYKTASNKAHLRIALKSDKIKDVTISLYNDTQ